MNRSIRSATRRLLCFLVAAVGLVALTAADVQAFQSSHGDGRPSLAVSGNDVPADPSQQQPQQPRQQPPPPQQPQQQQTAPPLWQRFSYGIRGIVTTLRDDSLETGVGFSGFAVLPLTTDLEVEGEVGFQTMSTIADGLPEGRLSVFPLRGTLRVQLWRFRGAMPYAGGGAGLYFHRFSLDAAAEQALTQLGFGAATTVDAGLALHVGGGVEWRRDRFHFGVDVKYVLGDTDVQSTLVDNVTSQVFRETSTLDLDGFWIAAGGRISF